MPQLPVKNTRHLPTSFGVLWRRAIPLQSYKIAAIPADGIGPEVTDAVIDAIRGSNE